TWSRQRAGDPPFPTRRSSDLAVVEPTVVADVDPQLSLSRDELFGPAVAVTPVAGIDEAIALANDSSYGLGAGIFTSNVTNALRRSEEHTSELQSRGHLVCRLL